MSKRYRVTLVMQLDAPYDVEADTTEQAEGIALGLGYELLCHECARHWNEGDIEVLEAMVLDDEEES